MSPPRSPPPPNPCRMHSLPPTPPPRPGHCKPQAQTCHSEAGCRLDHGMGPGGFVFGRREEQSKFNHVPPSPLTSLPSPAFCLPRLPALPHSQLLCLCPHSSPLRSHCRSHGQGAILTQRHMVLGVMGHTGSAPTRSFTPRKENRM